MSFFYKSKYNLLQIISLSLPEEKLMSSGVRPHTPESDESARAAFLSRRQQRAHGIRINLPPCLLLLLVHWLCCWSLYLRLLLLVQFLLLLVACVVCPSRRRVVFVLRPLSMDSRVQILSRPMRFTCIKNPTAFPHSPLLPLARHATSCSPMENIGRFYCPWISLMPDTGGSVGILCLSVFRVHRRGRWNSFKRRKREI